MTMDFAMSLMKLCKEGVKNKNLEFYKDIYQQLSSFWVSEWEQEYHTQEEKDKVYDSVKNMTL